MENCSMADLINMILNLVCIGIAIYILILAVRLSRKNGSGIHKGG
jgi:hypothetical protein